MVYQLSVRESAGSGFLPVFSLNLITSKGDGFGGYENSKICGSTDGGQIPQRYANRHKP